MVVEQLWPLPREPRLLVEQRAHISTRLHGWRGLAIRSHLSPSAQLAGVHPYLGPVSLWTVMALAMASNMSSWQVSVKVCEPILYWAWLM